ncbi:hypothetical protein MKEN_00484800 [Mycena kentingensis (nom. inval.)]|nr:hypothetical protein MKEN_00484800 [Mycena kentingensis (nom. inval.)]
MLHLFSSLTVVFTAAAVVRATYPASLFYQHPTNLFLENIAVRPSNQFLLTSVVSPTLFSLDARAPNVTTSWSEIHTFPNATGLTGITEYAPDQFAVVSSVLNTSTRTDEPGSVFIWRVDLSRANSHPHIRRIAHIPESTGANGLSRVPGLPDVVLLADSVAGSVYEINMRTGATRVLIQDALLEPVGPVPATGINGLHVDPHAQFAYAINSAQGTFLRIPLAVQHSAKLAVTGPVEHLATIPFATPGGPDDFALDKHGRAWVTVHPGSFVVISPPKEEKNGTWVQEEAVDHPENVFVFPGPTAAAFGRAEGTEETVYVLTGTGQIIAVDTTAGSTPKRSAARPF